MLINKLLIKARKKEIAQKALKLIQEDETIYLGPGTTIELLAEIMNFENLRVVTNCLPVFQTLRQKKKREY